MVESSQKLKVETPYGQYHFLIYPRKMVSQYTSEVLTQLWSLLQYSHQPAYRTGTGDHKQMNRFLNVVIYIMKFSNKKRIFIFPRNHWARGRKENITSLLTFQNLFQTQNKKTIHSMKEQILRRRGTLEDKRD